MIGTESVSQGSITYDSTSKPTYTVSDNGSGGSFGRMRISIDMAANGLSVGDTLQLSADGVANTLGTGVRLEVVFNNGTNDGFLLLTAAGTVSAAIPATATTIDMLLFPGYNVAGSENATFTNVVLQKL